MPGKRNLWLDLIRSVAISLVLLRHLGPHLDGFWAELGARGYFGIDLFFVLTGWLIGDQVLRKLAAGRLAPGRFWTRRWLRTLPAYYAVLLLLVAAGGRLSHPLSNLLFLQNYLHPEDSGGSWPLCVEEHFYLGLPLLVWAVHRNRRLALATGGALLVLSPALRWLAFPSIAGFAHSEASFATHLRLDGLALGVLLAAARLHAPALWDWLERRRSWLALCGVLLVCGTMALAGNPLGSFAAVWSFSLVSLGAALLVPAAVTVRPVRRNRFGFPLGKVNLIGFPVVTLHATAITLLAEHAYTLYLTHGIAYRFVEVNAPRLGWAGMLAGAALLAFLLRELVEKPGLRLREKWGHSLRFWSERPRLE